MLVIKDFNMPNNCLQCQFTCEDIYRRDRCIFTYNEVWECGAKRHESCPLVCEIPDDTVGIIGIQKGDTNRDILKQSFPYLRQCSNAMTAGNYGDTVFISSNTGWLDAPYERSEGY